MSIESAALDALAASKCCDERVRVGDLYVISDTLRYVMLVLGHRKNGRRISEGHTFVFMYHWDERSLRTKPADLRDHDGNSNCAEAWLESARSRGNSVRYVGNIFEHVPLSALVEAH